MTEVARSVAIKKEPSVLAGVVNKVDAVCVLHIANRLGLRDSNRLKIIEYFCP